MQESKYLLKNYKALGTTWFIEVFNNNEPLAALDSVSRKLKRVIKNFENRYSRFTEKSLLTKLNRERKLLNAPSEFVDLVKRGLEYYTDTEGVFNFGLADVLAQQGYGKIIVNPEEKVDSEDLAESIKIDFKDIYLYNNVTLDFGGFGKGYLVDKIANILSIEHRMPFFLINGGGDIYATSCEEEPIIIYLQDPLKTDQFKFPLSIKNSAICGSSTYKREWHDKEGVHRTHILDGKKILSEIRNRHAFVSAPDCTTADMLATVACINNETKYIDTLKRKYNFSLIEV